MQKKAEGLGFKRCNICCGKLMDNPYRFPKFKKNPIVQYLPLKSQQNIDLSRLKVFLFLHVFCRNRDTNEREKKINVD